MPRQNRVNPSGVLIAVNTRGSFMGNRGILHDDKGQLTSKRWAHKSWVTCLLEFKGRKRDLMTPDNYTELFFLDEATALSAGHRPCGECRREAYNHFKSAWIDGNKHLGISNNPGIGEIDKILHKERVTKSKEKVTYQEQVGNLPDGAFFITSEQDNLPVLIFKGFHWSWSPEGYKKKPPFPAETLIKVLTPSSIVNAFRAGYVPQTKI